MRYGRAMRGSAGFRRSRPTPGRTHVVDTRLCDTTGKVQASSGLLKNPAKTLWPCRSPSIPSFCNQTRSGSCYMQIRPSFFRLSLSVNPMLTPSHMGARRSHGEYNPMIYFNFFSDYPFALASKRGLSRISPADITPTHPQSCFAGF